MDSDPELDSILEIGYEAVLHIFFGGWGGVESRSRHRVLVVRGGGHR